MPTISAASGSWFDPADLGEYLGEPVPVARAEAVARAGVRSVVAAIGWDPVQSERSYRVAAARDHRWPTWGEPRCLLAGAWRVQLPALNVTSVTTDLAQAEWTDAGLVTFSDWLPNGTVLTYAAGWPTEAIPEALVSVAFDEAVRRLSNPNGLASFNWATGAESEQRSYTARNVAVADDDRLDAYRLLPGIA